jgi:general secretion pathway protein C
MDVSKLLGRHFWAVIVVLLAVASFLDAQGIVSVVGACFAADREQLAEPPLGALSPSTSRAASLHATSAEAILWRNPFDSLTGPLLDGDTATPPPDPAQSSTPECDDVRLLVVAATEDPAWSLAAFETAQDKGKSILRRPGGEVAGKTVERIGWDRVWLTSGVHSCQARMFETPAASSPALPSTAPTPGGGPAGVPEDIKRGIERVSATELRVDRRVVDRLLEDQAQLMREAHVVPDRENGRVVGMRLLGVRGDGLLGVLGLENGDRLEKINGLEMTSAENALQALARLPGANHLTVTLNRKGRETNLDYDIR